MILELGAIISGLNMAASALNKTAQATQDLSQISGYLSALAEGQHDLQRLQNTKTLSAADAVKAQLAKKEADDALAQVREAFVYSGNGQLWDDAMKAMAEARKARAAEVRRLELTRKRRKKELTQLAIVIAVSVGLIPLAIMLAIWLIFQI